MARFSDAVDVGDAIFCLLASDASEKWVAGVYTSQRSAIAEGEKLIASGKIVGFVVTHRFLHK